MKQKLSFSALAVALSCAVPSFAGPGLADGAAKFIGNITQSNSVGSDFTALWNQATAENGCKWGSVEGQRGKYNWGACDAAYNWAKQNGGHFKFHALVWGSQYPSWLNGLSVDETKKAITAWFDAVKEHYPEIEMIDVVNEAIRTGNNSYHSPYGKNNNIIPALGGDNGGNYQFVTTAFKMARERWPKAILIYNDYNTVQWNKDQGIQLIQTIKKNGAPVDAYGLQAHDMMSQGGGQGGSGRCLRPAGPRHDEPGRWSGRYRWRWRLPKHQYAQERYQGNLGQDPDPDVHQRIRHCNDRRQHPEAVL